MVNPNAYEVRWSYDPRERRAFAWIHHLVGPISGPVLVYGTQAQAERFFRRVVRAPNVLRECVPDLGIIPKTCLEIRHKNYACTGVRKVDNA